MNWFNDMTIELFKHVQATISLLPFKVKAYSSGSGLLTIKKDINCLMTNSFWHLCEYDALQKAFTTENDNSR